MKQLLFILSASLSLATAKAQITFEYKYDHDFSMSVYNLDDDGYKYAAYDTLAKEVKIYNLNHTVWKSTPLNLPASARITSLQWVSKKLFNLDNMVEFSVNYIDYASYSAFSVIFNEQGTVLHTIDNSIHTNVYNIEGHYKLITTGNPGYAHAVYSLPGTYNNGSSVGLKESTITQPGLYPNPMQSAARLSYALPDHVSSGHINIYNAAGVLVRKLPIGRDFDHVIITRDDLPAGNYLYEVTGGNYKSQVSKFTVTQ